MEDEICKASKDWYIPVLCGLLRLQTFQNLERDVVLEIRLEENYGHVTYQVFLYGSGLQINRQRPKHKDFENADHDYRQYMLMPTARRPLLNISAPYNASASNCHFNW
ncbi:hypothetical protein [Curvivirga aplysinae]|uniref:hypothetical protein n=1 Tax=Curvivirga aplysinae TaxID=2529852 RepID=UPI0012BB8407|nr:hypothetical protein [Curvivirga aplysinae]MTI09702.1 hypothetical protein [Curvivirga aplysinae]